MRERRDDDNEALEPHSDLHRNADANQPRDARADFLRP